MPEHYPAYNAALVRIIDADTQIIRIDKDHGTELTHPRGVRLLGIDAPERYTDAGKEAIAFVSQWFYVASSTGDPLPLVVVSDKYDKYGRVLGSIYRKVDGASLKDDLLAAGYGVPMALAAHLTIDTSA